MKFSSCASFFSVMLLRQGGRHCVSGFTSPISQGWLVRGGSFSITNYSTELYQATVSPSAPVASLEDERQKAISESMGIAGDSVVQSTFGGVSYWDTSAMNEFRVFFVLGGPGAGKGTQSTFLKHQYPCVHLSVGDLLREEQAKPDSPNGALISECLVAGKIVPVEISLALLQAAMEKAAQQSGKDLFFLVDGFPRNFDNLDGWNRCMSTVTSVWAVLMFRCPLQILEQRILSRAETSGRSDDNIKSAQKRFHTFESQTVPVIDTLREVQHILHKKSNNKITIQVEDIQGDQSIEQVWAETQAIVNKFLANDIWSANAKLIKAIETNDTETYRKICLYLKSGETMEIHEGPPEDTTIEVTNASIDFVTGTKATTSYQRVIDGQTVQETRVWSHIGKDGWVNVHFSRTPILLQ